MHTAILATKVGMTQVYDDDGNVQPVTVLEVGPCKVELLRTLEREGYNALQMSLQRDGKTVARREARIEPEARQYEVGEQLDAPFIEVGGKVDVIGTSKGRGFSGVVNPLFLAENTRMLFGDAKATISALVGEFKDGA